MHIRPQRLWILACLAAAALTLAPAAAHAASLTWDANNTGANVTDGAGTWLNANQWWDTVTSSNLTWVSGSDAVFGVGGTGGAVTLASPTTVNSFTFNPFSGTYTLGTAGQTITLNAGITMNSGAGNVTFASPITLGGGQTWTNNSASTLTGTGGVNNNGNTLILSGTGTFDFHNTANVITGAGGLTFSGSGLLYLDGAGTAYNHTFSGPLTINGGGRVMGYNVANSFSNANLTFNGVGGVYEDYWGSSFTRTLGSGAGQVQILGGTSGFSQNGNGQTIAITINNNSAYEVVWGAAGEAGNANATGYFNPSTLQFMSAASQGTANATFANKVDLNGTTRTIYVDGGTTGAAYATMSGVIRTSSGTAGLIKTGTGTLKLSGANTYNGGTTINGGIVSVNSLANGGATSAIGNSSSAAANLVLANGTTLQYTGGAASSDRSFTINGTANGDSATLDASGSGALNLTSTSSPAYGTANQTRMLYLTGSNTAANTLAANIADNGSGAVSLTKNGAGTWVLTGGNTYTGPTTLNAGELSVGAANNLGNGGTLYFNGGVLQITGTALNSFASLSRTVVINSLATVGLDINDAANTFTFDKSLPAGGLTLAGAGTVVFQNTVTSLTLNPQSGITYTYGGSIPDGSSGRTVTMAGPGTQVLQGSNTYTGATYLNNGTLTLSGNGALVNSAITFNGGALSLVNASAGDAAINRVNDSATITSNGGNLQFVNTSGANVYAETLGPVALTSGQLNVVESNNQTGAGSQTLTLSGLTQAGTSAITFSANGGLNTTKNMIVVSGSGTTPAGQIIGPWATVGTAANAQTDYAVYNGSAQVVPANIAANENETTWPTSWSATGNIVESTVTSLSASRTLNTLRYTGGAATLALGANNLETYGILNGGSGTLTISGTGALRTPTGGGNLYLTAGNKAITVSAPITNSSDSKPVAVVSSGSGGLTLSNPNNTFSGGLVINGGNLTLGVASDVLGAANSSVTINASTFITFVNNSITLQKSFALNNGALVTYQNGGGGVTITGAVTGNGGFKPYGAASPGDRPLYLSNLANTFTGPLILGGNISGAQAGVTVYVNSLGDAPGAGGIIFGSDNVSSAKASEFMWGTGATTALTLNNRQIVFTGTGNNTGYIKNGNANPANTININTDLLVNGTGNNTLQLGGNNTGNNTFAGKITDGAGKVSLTKSDAGTWVLSGANTYTGATTISGGTLIVSGSGSLNSGNYAGAISNAGKFIFSSSADQTLSGVISGTGSLTKDTSTTSTLTLSGANTYTGATTVSGGTLLIDGSISATSAVSVAAAGTLGGSGTVGGNTTISGTLAPGDSPGTLTFGQALTLNNGSTYDFEAGDLAAVSGALTLNSTWTLALGSGFSDGGSVTLFTYGSLTSGADLNPTINISDLGFTPSGTLSLTDTGTSIVLNGVSVPEPASLVLLALGGLLMAPRRRRRA